MMNPGKRIRQLRQEAGMSQQEFATIIGCTPQVVSNFERGYTSTRPEVLDKIAGLFSVPVDYLMGLTDIRTGEYVTVESEDEHDLIYGFRSMNKKERRILLGKMEEILAMRREGS